MDEEDPDLDFENSGHLCGSPLAPFAPFVFTPLILLYWKEEKSAQNKITTLQEAPRKELLYSLLISLVQKA